MFTLASTRFNTSTWVENIEYRKINNFNGCVYCSPQPMTQQICPDSLVFVIEMNNSLNRIEGIGLVKNSVRLDKYFKVYEAGNFNRYVFRGKNRIDREELSRYNNKLVNILDHILFKGKTHLKRGGGITTVTDKLLKNEICEGLDIKLIIRDIFKMVFVFCENELSNQELLNTNK